MAILLPQDVTVLLEHGMAKNTRVAWRGLTLHVSFDFPPTRASHTTTLVVLGRPVATMRCFLDLSALQALDSKPFTPDIIPELVRLSKRFQTVEVAEKMIITMVNKFRRSKTVPPEHRASLVILVAQLTPHYGVVVLELVRLMDAWVADLAPACPALVDFALRCTKASRTFNFQVVAQALLCVRRCAPNWHALLRPHVKAWRLVLVSQRSNVVTELRVDLHQLLAGLDHE